MALKFLLLFASIFLHASVKPGAYLNSEYPAIYDLIRGAKENLDIEIYTMYDPTVHQLINEAIERGVQVRVVMEPEPVGGKCKIFSEEALGSSDSDCQNLRKLAKKIKSRGGKFVPFDKETLCGTSDKAPGCVQHGKMALADNVALISTGNFDSTSFCGSNTTRCNRDYSLVSNESVVVSTLRDIFEADLEGKRYNLAAVIPSSLQSDLTVSPNSAEEIIGFIDGAKKSIELQTQYLKAPDINQALIKAAKRGVKVSLMLSSLCAFGSAKPSEIQRAEKTYSAFEKVGISTKVFSAANKVNGKPGYMHAKVMVVDGNRAWLGSTNGSNQSLFKNREYGLVFHNPSWVKAIQKVVQGDQNNPNTQSWQKNLECQAKDGVEIESIGELSESL